MSRAAVVGGSRLRSEEGAGSAGPTPGLGYLPWVELDSSSQPGGWRNLSATAGCSPNAEWVSYSPTFRSQGGAPGTSSQRVAPHGTALGGTCTWYSVR